ncbi:ATP-binding protein [Nonomuraea typhae]|uniref:ATP-binding protein n=1 Tax=Nonomuraea typhae TaxID=2603600 RepID=A0ABW7YX73_9ACTN
MLVGRDAEIAELSGLLKKASDGESHCLVLRGEAGIGKTALLEHAAARAEGMTVLRSTGVESESHLPYAGLHLLLGRHFDRITALPEPQARALSAAVGLGAPEGGRQFLVGLAVLTLLGDLAADAPVLCIVDDVQWLDQESSEVLTFAARRLQAEGVVALFAVRDPGGPAWDSRGLPERRLPGLDAEAARTLLAEVSPGTAGTERERLIALAGGNPLALQSVGRVAGQGGHAGHSHGTHAIEREVGRRLAAADAATRALLLVTAADDTGETSTVLRAAALFGAGLAELAWAEQEGLVRTAFGRVSFEHSLIRSAVYHHAPLAQRLQAHRALAEALDGQGEEDRRAWHLSAASVGPDEAVAQALEQTGDRALAGGGRATAATAYERAARLSADQPARERRAVAAATAAAEAGHLDRATALLDGAAVTDDDLRRHALGLRARIAEVQGRPDEAFRTLCALAECAGPEEAAEFYVRAVDAAAGSGDFAGLARVSALAAELPGGQRARDLAEVALAIGNPEDHSMVRLFPTVKAILDHDSADGDLWTVVQRGWWSMIIGDRDHTREHAQAIVDRCRREGAAGVLPHALALLARAQLLLGRHREARAAAEEGVALADATGHHEASLQLAVALGTLDALAGDEAACRTRLDRVLDGGLSPYTAWATAALSLLDLGLGRHEAALSRMEQYLAEHHPMGAIEGLPIMVEAAVRTGRPERGHRAAAELRRWADRVGRPWLLAVAERCDALLSGEADGFERALALGGEPFDRAQTQLLYGEQLRRTGAPARSRVLLGAAAESFERLGAAPWAARARTELRATGVTVAVSGAEDDPLERLTPQELQTVQLVAQGLTNRQVGARLFLSPRTVGHHLYTAFPKLGVTSRTQLAALIADDRQTGRS